MPLNVISDQGCLSNVLFHLINNKNHLLCITFIVISLSLLVCRSMSVKAFLGTLNYFLF